MFLIFRFDPVLPIAHSGPSWIYFPLSANNRTAAVMPPRFDRRIRIHNGKVITETVSLCSHQVLITSGYQVLFRKGPDQGEFSVQTKVPRAKTNSVG